MVPSSDSVSRKIHFHCSGCKHAISVPQGLAGRKCRCPKCSQINLVPELEVKLDDYVLLVEEDDEDELLIEGPDEPVKTEEATKEDSAAPIDILPEAPPGTRKAGHVGKAVDLHKETRPMTRAREVRTFVAKLREDMNDPLFGTPHVIDVLDDQISDWLENNPNYAVDRTNIIVGEMFSKKGNENVVMINVWFSRREDAAHQ